jgi:AcrR family transcriptional regulator
MSRKARSGATASVASAARSSGASDDDQKKAEKRIAIRRAAYRCFTKRGYHQTTVDDICEAAGISKGSFYWYYQSKQAIFHSILDTWGAEVEAELRRHVESALATADVLNAITAALESEIQRNRRIAPVWLEFFSQVQRDPEIRVGLVAFHERIRSAIARLLTELTDGAVAAHDAQTLAGLILTWFLGLMCEDFVTADERAISTHLRKGRAIVEALVGDALRVRRSSGPTPAEVVKKQRRKSR